MYTTSPSCSASRMSLFVAAIIAALQASPGIAGAEEVLRVGVSIPAAVAFLPLRVGMDAGMFRRQGLTIERADLGGAAKAQQALAAESLDIAVGGGPDLAIVAKGQHALAVAVITVAPRQTTLIVGKDNPMRAPSDLKGKTIGISTAGGLSHWVVRQLSRQLGWGPEGIAYAALGSDAAQVAGLRTGQIDATVMDLGAGLRLEEIGTGRIFLRVRDYIPKMITQAVYAGNAALAKRPEAVRRFLAGWFDTIAYMRANKAATVAMAAQQIDASPAVASRIYDELMADDTPAGRFYSDDGRFEPEGLRVLLDSLVEMGALKDAQAGALYTEDYLPRK
jgi:NitT/TauT family transport system substrate-binding protein